MHHAAYEQRYAIGDLLATLKNPKYSKIPLRIVRLPDGTFQVVLPSGNPAPPLPQAPPALPTPQTPAPVPAAPTPAVQVPAPPTEHTTGARQPWTRQTRPRAAAELAVRLDYVDKADFGKLSMDVVNDHMRSLSDHLLEFPELRHTQNFAGSMQSYLRNANEEAAARVTRLLVSAHPELALPENSERLRRNLKYHAKKEKAPARAWAFSARGRGGSGVSFNEKYGAPAALAKLRPSLAHNVETKWHPEGCDTIKAVADHEYGHQLDTLLGLSGNAEVGNLYKEAAGTNLPGYDWRQSAANIGGSVSRYAATNMQEFVAEAWSEVRNNPNPRPIAARLGAIVRSEYAKKFGRPA